MEEVPVNEVMATVTQVNACKKRLEDKFGPKFDRKDGRRDEPDQLWGSRED